MHRAVLTYFAAASLSPSVAYASGGGWSGVIWHAVNLIVLVAVVVYFARRPIQRALEDRASHVGREVEEARELHAAAQSRLDDYEARISKIDGESKALLDELRREGEAEKVRLIEEAKIEAARIRRDAELTAENGIRRARMRLEAEIIDRAIDAARDVVARGMTASDRTRLAKAYLDEMEKSAGA